MTNQNQLRWAYLSPAEGFEGDHHVIPENDLLLHELSSECWCRPEDDPEPHDYVWHHNAKDGREAYETRQRKPN